MPGAQTFDKDSHPTPTQDTATQLTAGAVSTTAVGTISPTTAAGASPTVTIGDCSDYRGNFLLNPVTGGGAQADGEVVVVKFVKPYTKAPAAILVTMENETDGNVIVPAAAVDITADGFEISVDAALTTAKAYRTQYVVTP